MANPLKTAYRHLSRFPWVERLREVYRQKIQLHYWPWYRRKPTVCGIEPDVSRYKHELIVSLTSFPARIHIVQYALYSLLRQSLKPNRIVLWLADEQFPGKENDLPKELLELKPLGLEIRWCEDIKSFKKLIPSLREFPEAIIVTADDDIHYPRHWLCSLYLAWLEHGQSFIHAGGVESITFDSDGQPAPFAQWKWNPADARPAFKHTFGGCYGVLYPPHCLHSDVLDGSKALELSPSSDDFWFWTHALRNGTKIRLVMENRQQILTDPRVKSTPELWTQNYSGGGNDLCFTNLLLTYPELFQTLKIEQMEVLGCP